MEAVGSKTAASRAVVPKLAFSLLLKPPITRMERLSVEACLTAGYDFRMYIYGDYQKFGVIPTPGCYADARQILPESECRPDGDGTFRTFQHRFMCAALFTHGGLWVDTDYVLTRALPAAPFLGIVGHDDRLQTHALRLPAGSALALMAEEAAIDAANTAREVRQVPFQHQVMSAIYDGWPSRTDAKLLPAALGCPLGPDKTDLVINPAPKIQPDQVYGYKLWRSLWETEDTSPTTKFHHDAVFEQLWWRYFGMLK